MATPDASVKTTSRSAAGMPAPKPFRSLPPVDQNQRYEINEAAAYLRISRAKLYADIAAGTLTPLRDGARIFIPGSEIIRRSTLTKSTIGEALNRESSL